MMNGSGIKSSIKERKLFKWKQSGYTKAWSQNDGRMLPSCSVHHRYIKSDETTNSLTDYAIIFIPGTVTPMEKFLSRNTGKE